MMEKWQTVINLKFRRVPWRFKVGFSYEWKAWLIAYDHFGVGPEEFSRMEVDKQINALAYGAAAWHCMKKDKRVFFTYEEMGEALLRASKAENLMLSHAMSYAQFPEWLKSDAAGDKKKDES